jgi:hypothetical protein
MQVALRLRVTRPVYEPELDRTTGAWVSDQVLVSVVVKTAKALALTLPPAPPGFSVDRLQEIRPMTVYVIADIRVTDDRWIPGYAASVHELVHKPVASISHA